MRMRIFRIGLPVFLLLLWAATAGAEAPRWALAIHGGAGVIVRDRMDAQTEQQYRQALQQALTIGEGVFSGGGSSLDAVEQVIRFLEDSPLFNAGRGAVFTEDGRNEMDASVMYGPDRQAGAVAGVTNVRHPITAARRVMTDSPHVMLAREGAEAFAAEQGLEIVDPSFFRTEKRWESYLKAKAKRDAEEAADPESKHGTVGCVALDQDGNLAAGTSTGGMTLKKWGRIGDSPIIGAGTWACNNTCAVSATGHGEFFIRNAVAHDIAALVEYKEMPLQQAADLVIQGKLVAQAAEGGIIALNTDGDVVFSFNTPGMYRGYLKAGGVAKVFVFGDE